MKKLLTLVLIGAFVLAALPSTFAYFPPPPPPPGEPELAMKIDGKWSDITHPVKFTGLVACTTIEVEVMAVDFVDLYAYNFIITWDATVFSLTSHEVKHIHTADFVVNVTVGSNFYKQVVTAINPALGFNGTAALANLFFHIDNDVQWPDQVEYEFGLTGTTVNSCTQPIDNSEQPGYVKLIPVQPTIKMLPPVTYKSVVGETFEVQFEIQDIVKMKSFHFIVTWDPTQLETDAQNVWIKDFLPPPYEYTYIFVGSGYLEIVAQMPCEKPPINGTGELFGIRFTTLNPWGEDGIPPYTEYTVVDEEELEHPLWIPDVCWNYININGYIDKDDGTVYQYLGTANGIRVKGPNVNPLNPAGKYTLNGNAKDKFIYSNGTVNYMCDQVGFIIGYYEFRPIPGDLDLDGHADIVDLSAIAKVYGVADTGFDLDGSGFVDLVDVVIVAKNICRTEPDPNLPWPILDP